ncbi:MAG: PEP-CTERM sorting domain-containing protein [Sedimentisphaerales bacterium]
MGEVELTIFEEEKKMKRLITICVIAVLLMVGSSKAALLGYTVKLGSDESPIVCKTNFTTGSQVSLGPSSMPSGPSDWFYSLALSPSDGYLYASTWNDGLWQINPATGASTKLSLIPSPGANPQGHIVPLLGSQSRLAFSPAGTLYGTGPYYDESDSLATIDLSTKQTTVIKRYLEYTVGGLCGFAIDQSGQAIGVSNCPDPRGNGGYVTSLLNISLFDGRIATGQLWNSPSNGFYSLCYGPDGTLYGDTGGYRQLYTINTQNLSASPIGVPFNGDVPFVITPEPATLLLLGLGGLLFRKKRSYCS